MDSKTFNELLREQMTGGVFVPIIDNGVLAFLQMTDAEKQPIIDAFIDNKVERDTAKLTKLQADVENLQTSIAQSVIIKDVIK